MLKIAHLTSAIILAAVGFSAAKAALIDYTYHGTVQQLTDPYHLFGMDAEGSLYTLVFRVDTNRGFEAVNAGGYHDENLITGGTIYADLSDADHPTIQLSPVSARLTINNHALNFLGRYQGQANVLNDCFGELFGGHCTSSAGQSAEDTFESSGGYVTDFVTAGATADYYAALTNLAAPLAWAIDGVTISGSGSFRYQLSGQDVATSGTLIPSDLTVAPAVAVPEIGTWVMMLAGFGWIGLMQRGRVRKIESAYS